jgi:hypothetical protein
VVARAERTVTRTVNVRLRRDGKAWEFDRLASAGGTPVDRPADLPAAAAAVVTTLSSGHPYHVFGTELNCTQRSTLRAVAVKSGRTCTRPWAKAHLEFCDDGVKSPGVSFDRQQPSGTPIC